MNRILVAYFSHSGYTRKVAERIARELGAELSAIEETTPGSGIFWYLRAAWEAMRERDAAIAGPVPELGEFDLVVIGSPVWAAHLSSPVRAFAHQHGSRIRRVAFFSTMGGRGAAQAFADLERLVGRAPVATLALTDAEIDSGAADAKIERFAESLHLDPVAR